MGTNSSPPAALPKDGACKSVRHHLNAAICLGVRGDVARGGKDPKAHRSSHYIVSSLFRWWVAAGALQTYSDARV